MFEQSDVCVLAKNVSFYYASEELLQIQLSATV